MPARSNDAKGVCASVRPSVYLSVCPSIKRVNCDKTEEKSVQIFILYERSFSLIVGGGDPFYLKFWVKRPTRSPIFNRYSLVTS